MNLLTPMGMRNRCALNLCKANAPGWHIPWTRDHLTHIYFPHTEKDWHQGMLGIPHHTFEPCWDRQRGINHQPRGLPAKSKCSPLPETREDQTFNGRRRGQVRTQHGMNSTGKIPWPYQGRTRVEEHAGTAEAKAPVWRRTNQRYRRKSELV